MSNIAFQHCTVALDAGLGQNNAKKVKGCLIESAVFDRNFADSTYNIPQCTSGQKGGPFNSQEFERRRLLEYVRPRLKGC